MQCNTTVQGFTGPHRGRPGAAVHVRLRRDRRRGTCTRCDAGDVPLALLFSGTVFTRGDERVRGRAGAVGLRGAVRLPVAVWRRDDRVATSRTPAGSGSTTTCSAALGRLPVPARPDHLGRDRAARLAGRGGRCAVMTPRMRARAVADAVLYEGYLLYPYRASAAKNRSRWQFGVLGPPAAAPPAFAEAPDMAMQCLLAIPRCVPPAVATASHIRSRAARAPAVPAAAGAARSRLDAGRVVHAGRRARHRRDSGADLGRGGGARDHAAAIGRWPGTRHEFPVDVPGGEDVEPTDGAGRPGRAPPVAAARAGRASRAEAGRRPGAARRRR